MNAIFRKRLSALIASRDTAAKLSALVVLAASCVAWPAAVSAAENPPNGGVHKAPDTRKPTAEELEAWRGKIVHAPPQKKGACYSASYPDTSWHEVPCQYKPHKAYLPRMTRGMHTFQVGGNGGTDFSAETGNGGGITEAEGSFDSATTSGETNVPTSGASTPESYTLQLNTAPFSTALCNGAPGTGDSTEPCQGWQQFVYTTDSNGEISIQYWLLWWGQANAKCSSSSISQSTQCDGSHVFTDGWCPFDLADSAGNTRTFCAINGPTNSGKNNAGIGAPNVSSLTEIGIAAFPDHMTATLPDPNNNNIPTANNVSGNTGNNSFSDLASNWKEAEFNIFGDGNDSVAQFNANSTLEVRTSVASGTTVGPVCVSQSFTGESNNLTLVATTSNPQKGSLPSLVFTETNAGNPTTAGCASAISLGDTHVHPFNGQTEYDFQAFGDFLLVETGPDFMVHTRQVPGPPGYPGTATNTAVAVMMGRTRIAVYLQPARLVIDGKTDDLADGKTLTLPAGVQVTRKGAEYVISDEHGNLVRADLAKNGSEALWMNVTVGLGRSPDSGVRGLLGNPSDKADEIKTARGATLKVPVDVKDLYGQFADSWRVDPAKSLFVELPPAQIGAPKKPLIAADLDPTDKAHAVEACHAAGVTNEALLDDCVLDTTVLKDDAAVRIFTKVAPPKLVIKPVVLHIEPK